MPTGIIDELDKDLAFQVQQTLQEALGAVKGSRRSILFTGGFDSLLMAKLAEHGGAQVTAVTIQFEDFNPLTVAEAMESAKKADLSHQILTVGTVDYLSAFEELAGITDEPVYDLDLPVVYAALKKYVPSRAGDVFISGMGSDQWFGNIALEANALDFAARLKTALDHERAHHQVAQAHDCRFCFPFLSRAMLALSQTVPPNLKKDKKLLRSLPIAHSIPYQATSNEVQVPLLIRHLLIKTYGLRAWGQGIPDHPILDGGIDRKLRQIILGLWLQKNRTM